METQAGRELKEIEEAMQRKALAVEAARVSFEQRVREVLDLAPKGSLYRVRNALNELDRVRKTPIFCATTEERAASQEEG